MTPQEELSARLDLLISGFVETDTDIAKAIEVLEDQIRLLERRREKMRES
jgi:hypothetical protein